MPGHCLEDDMRVIGGVAAGGCVRIDIVSVMPVRQTHAVLRRKGVCLVRHMVVWVAKGVARNGKADVTWSKLRFDGAADLAASVEALCGCRRHVSLCIHRIL